MRRLATVGVALVAALAVPSVASAADPPGCSGAGPYAIYVSTNEANFIGQKTGLKITNQYVVHCARDWASNLTQVYWRYDGRNFGGYGDAENIQMSTWVGGTSGNYNLGTVDWVHSRPGCCNIGQSWYNTPNE